MFVWYMKRTCVATKVEMKLQKKQQRRIIESIMKTNRINGVCPPIIEPDGFFKCNAYDN